MSVEPIDIHTCSQEELDLFYPLQKSYDYIYRSAKPYMFCLDYSKVKIQGSFNSANFIRPSISFNIPSKECRDGPYDSECITTKEYEDQWNNKGIVLL